MANIYFCAVLSRGNVSKVNGRRQRCFCKDGLEQEKSVMKMEVVNSTQDAQHSEDTAQSVLRGPMWMLSAVPEWLWLMIWGEADSGEAF